MKKVSIIIPVYNRRDSIDLTINSCLSQDYTPLEVIVVDDGSTDGVAEHLEKYGQEIVYFFQFNQGAPIARNKGLELSTGEYILFLDAGDILEKGSIRKLMSYYEDEVQLVMGNLVKKYGKGTIKKQDTILENKVLEGEDCYAFCCLSPQPSTKMYRKNIIASAGICFTKLPIGQDLAFHLKYLLNCKKVHVIPDYITCMNVIDGGISRTYSGAIAGIVDALHDVEEYAKSKKEYYQGYTILCHIGYYHLFWQMVKVPLIKEQEIRKKVSKCLLEEYRRLDKMHVKADAHTINYYLKLDRIMQIENMWVSNWFHAVYSSLFRIKEVIRFRR